MKRALLRLSAGFVPAMMVGFFAIGAQAATVTIQAPAEVVKGQTFQVNYVVQGAKEVDTVRFNGDYTQSLIELKSMVPSALDSRSPGTAFNQADGSYSFGAFTIAGATNGAVKTGVFTFTATQLGTATVSLKDGSLVLSAGENQLTGLASAQIRIVEEKGEARVTPSSTNTGLSVTSVSHPNENLWYKNRDIQINWKAEGAGIASVFVAFDDQPEGPATEKVANSGSKTFSAPKDGVWYAHIIVSFADGKRLRRDYRLQIDTTTPKPFALSSDYQQIDASVPNFLRFAAIDETSGIGEYAIYAGDQLVTTTTNPFFAITGQTGEKMYTVKATDLAGNVTTSVIRLRLGAEYTKPQQQKLWWVVLIAMFLVAITGLLVGMIIMRRRREEKPATKKTVHRIRRK